MRPGFLVTSASCRAIALALAMGLAPAGHVAAQSSDVKALTRDLERLRADLKDLQRYVYSGGPLPESVAVATVTPGGESAAAQVEVRLTELDQVMRDMRGQLEELGFRVTSLETRLDQLVADIDLRLAALERGGAVVEPGSGQGTEPTAGATTTTEGTLGTMTVPSEPATTTAALPEEPLPPGSVMEQYNYAFSLLGDAEYDKAERALGAFVEAHPDDPLAGNALYWLGETYFVRGDYNRAAVTFLRGYREFPEGSKAPDNLLKLGITLGKLDKRTEACATFAELGKKFPNASATIRKKATDEAGALGCG